MTTHRLHVLKLNHGDLFRYQADGPTYRVVVRRGGKDQADRYLAEPVGRPGPPAAIEWENCFILPVEPDEPEDDS